MDAHVDTNSDDQHAGQVRCTTSHGAQPRPAVGSLFSANSCRSTDSDQRERQANTEAQDEHTSQSDLFNLKAEQQNGNGGRARNQTARQTKHDDLARGVKDEGQTDLEMDKLRSASLHWLRHTAATFDAPFRDIKDLQADLRHESMSTTQNTYYNALDQNRAKSVKGLGIKDRG